jgi:hypothetical protein
MITYSKYLSILASAAMYVIGCCIICRTATDKQNKYIYQKEVGELYILCRGSHD